MTAGSIVAGLSIVGEKPADVPATDSQQSKADRRREQAGSKDAERMSRVRAKADAKSARAQVKAEAKAARDEAKATAKSARDEARAETEIARSESTDVDGSADDLRQAKAQAKAARAEAKAAGRRERRAANQAKREARETAPVDKIETTEPVVDDDDDDGTERPIAVAAKLQRDNELAAEQRADARESLNQQAARAKQAADEAKRKAKVEAADAQAEADAAKQKEREKAAAEKAKADGIKQREREEAASAKAAAKRERDEAKVAAKEAAREAKSSHRADDHIVEAPREPKKSLVDRLRPEPTGRSGDDEAARSSVLPTLAVVLGALGFAFSVILAIGAFMVALNPQGEGALFGFVSNICDILVGPLRGLFSFSGVNGESKDALVAWGLGALGYLILGLFAQSFLRARSEHD